MVARKRGEEGRPYLESARTLYQGIVAQTPGDREARRGLSVVWNKLGDLDTAQKRWRSALDAYRKALAERESLATSAGPTPDARAQRDLSVSLGRIGRTLSSLGDLPGALEAFEKMRRTDEALLAADPVNVQAQRDVAVTYSRLGEVQDRLARDAARPVEMRRTAWHEAARWFTRSLQSFEALRTKGGLRGYDERTLTELRAGIAECQRQARLLGGQP